MKNILKSADGFYFELDSPPAGQEVRVGDAGELVVEVDETLTDVLETRVKPAAEKIVAALRQVSPKEITVEFGIKITGEAGAIFTKAGVEGHFTIKMKWDRAQGEKG